MQFLHLQLIYEDMRLQGRKADVFNVRYNRHPFRCMFLADEMQKTLFICTTGENAFVIRLELNEHFECSALLDPKTYSNLCNYLELHYDPAHPFRTSEFFSELDSLFPTQCTESPAPAERATIINRSFSSELKPYFKGWIPWKKKHTSEENMYLTASLIGFTDAERCKQANVSSAWSSNPNDENLDALDQWAAMVENQENGLV